MESESLTLTEALEIGSREQELDLDRIRRGRSLNTFCHNNVPAQTRLSPSILIAIGSDPIHSSPRYWEMIRKNPTQITVAGWIQTQLELQLAQQVVSTPQVVGPSSGHEEDARAARDQQPRKAHAHDMRIENRQE